MKAALGGRCDHRVREYCAIGDLLPTGMAYLVRRLLENTSNEGFLRIKNTGEATRDALLANPVEALVVARERPPSRGLTEDGSPFRFKNAANTDFSQAANREKQRAALKTYSVQLGKKWPLVIAGKKISDRDYVPSVNPAKPSQVVGSWARATIAPTRRQPSRQRRAAFPKWRAKPRKSTTAQKSSNDAADLMEAHAASS